MQQAKISGNPCSAKPSQMPVEEASTDLRSFVCITLHSLTNISSRLMYFYLIR